MSPGHHHELSALAGGPDRSAMSRCCCSAQPFCPVLFCSQPVMWSSMSRSLNEVPSGRPLDVRWATVRRHEDSYEPFCRYEAV